MNYNVEKERVRNYWTNTKGTTYVSIPKYFCKLLELGQDGKFMFKRKGNKLILEKL